MYVLVLVACMTVGGETHCQTFQRDHQFETHNRCITAAAIERGRYAERRQQRKEWLTYSWRCRETDLS